MPYWPCFDVGYLTAEMFQITYTEVNKIYCHA